MGTKLVSNIKNFIISGRHQGGIKTLVKASYPNGYRNFGPDLDRVMLPLNNKYVDASKLVESINEEISDACGGNGSGSYDAAGTWNGKDNYFISVLKCLVDYIQWDVKKDRENYAKYGMFLFLKLIETCNESWIDSARLTGFIKSQSENWLSKDQTLLQCYGKWIILINMRRTLENNIQEFYREMGVSTGGYGPYDHFYSEFSGPKNNCITPLPVKNCTLNQKLIEFLCRNANSIRSKLLNCSKKSKDKEKAKEIPLDFNTNKGCFESSYNKELVEMTLILEIILLGLIIEEKVFREESKMLISESILLSMTSIVDSKSISNFGVSLHNAKYYLNNTGPGKSLFHTLNMLRKDNNLFFQGDRVKQSDLIEDLYTKYLFLIEALSANFSRECIEERQPESKSGNTSSPELECQIALSGTSNCQLNVNSFNELGLIQRFKAQDRIHILPLKFRALNEKLFALYYYPYILTSDICLSICRGNSNYTVELITLIICALKYHIINNNSDAEESEENGIFQSNEPFFIIDELMTSISVSNDEIPKYILFYETPKYCYSLLRCLHRVLCCCPRTYGISRLVSTLVTLIDVILPLYDLNGILCSRSKNTDNPLTGVNGNRILGDFGKCALLMRNVAFQVLFDIMCIFSETSQVFYVIRVLVKVRDWCGSCLLDLIRRCQRLASQCELKSNQKMAHSATHSGQGKQKTHFQSLEKMEVLRTREGEFPPCFSRKNQVRTSGNSHLHTGKGFGGSGLGNGSGNFVSSNTQLHPADMVGPAQFVGSESSEMDLETVNPSFWGAPKILEIAGINRKWITGQIGNSNNNYVGIGFSGVGGGGSGGLTNGGVGGGLSSGGIGGLSSGSVASGLSSDTIVSSKTTQVIFNRIENGGIGGASMGVGVIGGGGSCGQATVGGALGTDVVGGSTAPAVLATATTGASQTGANFQPGSCTGGGTGVGSCGAVGLTTIQRPASPFTSNYCYCDEDEEDGFEFDETETSSDDSGSDAGGYGGEDYEGGENDEEDGDYWEADEKLLELIRLRPTSSIINAQPPTVGILRRTVSSEANRGGAFSKIGGGISSFWTKHNSAPPRTLSSMKRVCFAEVTQIY
ncbi:hypothetical protein HWI79_3166 [Cryptosporidium felis]|nr:hypothetical protein HWI79_3166 [Cryptosporidium felis]